MGFEHDLKPVLGIDTSFGSVSVCVIDGLDFAPLAHRQVELERGHAEALVPLIKEVVNSADLNFRDLGSVAVSVGPGSFTGVRVGLAAARAIGLVTRIDVVGVSTLSAFAAPFLGRGKAILASVVEARYGYIYFHCFDHNGATVAGPRLGSIKDMLAELGWEPIALVGNAAHRVEEEAALVRARVTCAAQLLAPSVLDVARLGALSSSMIFPPRPSYLS